MHVCPEDAADIPDLAEARLVILHPKLTHKRGVGDSDAIACAKSATEHRGAANRTDSTTTVVGYSVALPLAGGEKPLWYGGGRLSRELTLPRLRESWPAGAQPEAWRRSAGKPERTATPPSAELQARFASELAALREQLRRVPGEDHATWAQAARETAGIFAAWSLRTEPVPGPLAATARSLARSGQLRTQIPVRAQLLPAARSTARMLLSAGLGGRSNLAVLTQLANLAKAMHDMHYAAGQAERAAEIERSARRELSAVTPTALALGEVPRRAAARTARITRRPGLDR